MFLQMVLGVSSMFMNNFMWDLLCTSQCFLQNLWWRRKCPYFYAYSAQATLKESHSLPLWRELCTKEGCTSQIFKTGWAEVMKFVFSHWQGTLRRERLKLFMTDSLLCSIVFISSWHGSNTKLGLVWKGKCWNQWREAKKRITLHSLLPFLFCIWSRTAATHSLCMWNGTDMWTNI